MSNATSKGMMAATLGILAAGGGLPLEELPRLSTRQEPQEPTEFGEERMRKADEKRDRKAAKRLRERQND